MTKQETIVHSSASEIGSPYVYGTWGLKVCSVELRKKYGNLRPSQKAKTYARCQCLRDKNQKSSCDGCKYKGRLAFDCRGFVWWLLKLIGIIISGQSVATQWSTSSNWVERGDIAAMPDLVCCVFIKEKSGKWSHVGMHIGGGQIIHCSGEVKRDTVGGDRKWSHYAIPAGLYTADEIEKAHKERGIFTRTLKKGTRGEDVRAMQEMLNNLGYYCGTADGIFGSKTVTAVKAFQAAECLTVDGIAGTQTLETLAARAAVVPAPGPSQDELPEDDDDEELPAAVTVNLAQLLEARTHAKAALEMIEKMIGGVTP